MAAADEIRMAREAAAVAAAEEIREVREAAAVAVANAEIRAAASEARAVSPPPISRLLVIPLSPLRLK